MKTATERVRELMRELDLTQIRLARRAGCSQSYLSEALKRGRISTNLALKLSQPLKTSPSYILHGVGPAHPFKDTGEDMLDELEMAGREMGDGSTVNEKPERYRYGVPQRITFQVAASVGNSIDLHELSLIKASMIPATAEWGQVIGDSMSPLAWPGQKVAVDWAQRPGDGDLAIVVLKDGRCLFKRYWTEGNKIILESLRRPVPSAPERGVKDIIVSKRDIERAGTVIMVDLRRD